ncbi:MAG: SsrA-binding protein SmpB [Planctomycetes bacterium]|nr:SsrA-binding protein SmpB [Planctomycetota bacterium]
MAKVREIRNKRAYFDYHVLEKVEAGIVLRGTEVKSIREGNVSLQECYARIDGGEVFLVGCHIPEYRPGGWTNHDPLRKRKLLLHQREIRKLEIRVEEKGLTLVPLRIFFNQRGFAKLELGVCKGKKRYDKRETLKAREAERDIRRQMGRG